MKQKLLFSFSLLFFIFSIPLFISLKELNKADLNLKLPEVKLDFLKSVNIKNRATKEEKTDSTKYEFKVLDHATGTVIPLTLKDFILGTVATEMPIRFEPEALKAQAVAAYTYFSNLKEKNGKNPDCNLNGADFAVDSSKWLYYVSKEQMKARWGNDFDFYYNKLSQAIEPVLGQSLKQDGNYIEALYHSISSGATENIENVFGGNQTYLRSVASPGDLLAPGYLSSKEVSLTEAKNMLKSKWSDVSFEEDAENFIKVLKRAKTGLVLEAKIGSKIATGREIRELFSLRSANFDIEFKDEKVIFTVKGYGHGVGMSQYGAQYMAQQGSNYKQILAWYYPGAELTL